VKYGDTNAEVYAEVAATRLLWALGFGADAWYPVKVICRQCPSTLGGTATDDRSVLFDVAAIERKFSDREINAAAIEGWAWPELDLVDESKGGAPPAHRDALKLLAGLLQHTDNKPEQQRLVCVDSHAGKKGADGCEHPFMFLHDVGMTFGAAHWTNDANVGSVNLVRWTQTPIWRDVKGCVANLHASITGSLEHPLISEEGRAFLSGLLAQLSDQQLRDLFEVARFPRRGVQMDGHLSNGTIDEWVAAFKQKRDDIANRHCDSASPPRQ
jgi:hypothetical protein